MKNIVVASFNSGKNYFLRGLTLISAIHRTSFDSVDKIIIYNLGFSAKLKNFLESIEKVEVVEYPEYLNSIYPDYLNPGMFAWKCFILADAQKYNANIFYIDGGVAPINDLKEIFEIIEKEEIFVVGNTKEHTIRKWTQAKCLDILKIQQDELDLPMISAGIIGYKSKGKYQYFFDDAFELQKLMALLMVTKVFIATIKVYIQF